MLDDIDRKILQEISEDSRRSVDAISREVGLSATPVRRRIRRMEEQGILTRYSVEIDLAKCGYVQRMYVFIKLKSRDKSTISQFESRIRLHSEISSCNLVTGPFDYILEIHMKDMAGYNRFLRDVLSELPEVFGIETSVVINHIKSEMILP